MSTVTLEVSELTTPISVPSNPTGGNKATIKKMVVADPGLGMQIKMDCDSSIASQINAFLLIFYLGKKNEQQQVEYHHQVNVRSNTTNGALDLSQDLIFVAPFIDTRYAEDTDTELDYRVRIEYHNNDSCLAAFEKAGVIPKADIFSNKQFSCKLDGQLNSPHIITPAPPSESNAIKYSRVLFHELGGSFELSFPAAASLLSSSYSYLLKTEAENSNYKIMALKPDYFSIHDKGFSWLPYPRSVENNQEVTETSISIEPFIADSPETEIVNLNYPVSILPVTPATGNVQLVLV